MDYGERQELLDHRQCLRWLVDQVEGMQRNTGRSASDDSLNNLRQIISDLYSQQVTYTNLVIAAGYAAAFAAWQFVDRFISLNARLISALALLLSVSAFIGFEVFKTIREGIRMRRLSGAVMTLPEPQRLSAIKNILLENQIRDARIWLFALIPTVVGAVAFAGIIIGAVGAKLLGYILLP